MYCNRDINLMEASKECFTEIVVMLQTSNMKGYLQLLDGLGINVFAKVKDKKISIFFSHFLLNFFINISNL